MVHPASLGALVTYRLPTALVAFVLLTSCSPSSASLPTARPVSAPAGVVEAYRTWALYQADELVLRTQAFTSAYLAGDRNQAQTLYAPARSVFYRIASVTGDLGELVSRIDAVESLQPAPSWGGFHRLEKLLWSTDALGPGDEAARSLLTDVQALRTAVETANLSIDSLVNGPVRILKAYSARLAAGGQERYSHTELWDLQATVEGAETLWSLLSRAVESQNPDLAKTIDARFSSIHGLLEVQRKGDGFRPYTEVYPKEVKALSAALDSLADPLARLSGLFSDPGRLRS